jgi:hypothetical protein
LQLRLLNGYTPDFDGTIISNVIASPENPNYANDTGQEDTNALGVLPMGLGRHEIPNNAYTAPIMVAAKAPAIPGLQYMWKRWLTRRSWYIQTTNSGVSWNVTQRSRRVAPDEDTDDTDDGTYSNTNPSSPKQEFYEFDNSALGYGGLLVNDTNGFMHVGDYIHEEKAFTYQILTSFDGVNWTTNATLPVQQLITIRYQGTNGTAATDWVGITNLQTGNTNSVGIVTPIITSAKVQAIVGTTNITIDPAANY